MQFTTFDIVLTSIYSVLMIIGLLGQLFIGGPDRLKEAAVFQLQVLTLSVKSFWKFQIGLTVIVSAICLYFNLYLFCLFNIVVYIAYALVAFYGMYAKVLEVTDESEEKQNA